MPRHVLVPMDDSDASRAALEHACEHHAESTITVVHVVDPNDSGTYTSLTGGPSDEFSAEVDRHEDAANAVFDDARAIAADYGVEIETATLSGNVARSVVTYVTEHDIGHVIVGSHGRTGVSRILLGSTAEKIARRTPVPVTIVR